VRLAEQVALLLKNLPTIEQPLRDGSMVTFKGAMLRIWALLIGQYSVAIWRALPCLGIPG
jgi:hypothetical protein